MKTVHRPHNDNEECSCTSCIYKSKSDRLSLRNFVAQSSRIDRLYYGKYIPLREKKLLDRLVRTRAVYDDIRAQLISDSTIDLNKKPNLKLRSKLSGKQLDIDKSSAVLKLVNMVDKGEILSSKNLSQCCSCCSCSTGLHLHNETLKKQRHKRGHPGVHRHEYRISEKVGDGYGKKGGVRFKAKHIRSDPCTCTFQFSGLLQNLSNTKMRKLRLDRPSPAVDLLQSTDVEIRQKRRTLKRSQEQLTRAMVEGIKKLNESKVYLRENLELGVKKSLDKLNQAKEKLKSKSKAHPQINIYEHPSKIEFGSLCECPELDLVLDIKKRSLSKFKEGIKKINEEIKESKTKIVKNLEIQVKKSLEKFKKTKDKIKTKIHTQKSPYGAECACPELDLISHIRKDSIAKFKDDIRKKQMLKDWTCDFECIEDTCKPDECSDKLKKKKSFKIRAHGNHDLIEREKIKQERKIGEPTNLSSVKIQAFQKTAAVPVETKRVKPKLRTKQTKVTSSPMQFKHKPLEIHNGNKLPSTKSCYCKTISKDIIQPQQRRDDRILKKHNTEHLKINQQRKIKHFKKIEVKTNKLESEEESRPRQAVRIGSSFSFNIEFYKDKKEPYQNKPPLPIKYYEKNKGFKKLNRRNRGSQGMLKQRVRDAKIGAQALNRCFCTFQLKGKKHRINKEGKEETLFTKGTVNGFDNFNTPCTRSSCIFSDKCIMTDCKRIRAKNKNLPKMQQENLHYRQHLLPYECEPGVCTPNYCDPYQCIKLINMRKTKIKKSSVKCGCPRKTKSTSSLISKSNMPPKAKYVQSVIEYTRIPKKVRDFAKKSPNLRRQTVNNLECSRQTVRIGSTFSFNIEFHKNKFPKSAKPAYSKNLSIKPTRNLHLNPNLKIKKYIKDIYRASPTQHVIKRNRFYGVGGTLKRCFCTFKLQEKYLNTKNHKMLTTGTKTEENSLIDVRTSNKSTKIDRKNVRQLEPFECEPFICIPGECDPYKCLERIKKRLKDASILATQPVITAGSSTIYSENISSKTIQVDTKPKAKHEKTYMKAKKRKENFKKTYDPMERQAVRIGSSFNFNIELYKKNIPKYSKSEYLKEKKGKKILKNKTLDKDIKTTMFTVSDKDTQIQRPKKHKGSMVSPLLKRCFCTLNLQKKQKQQISTYNFSPRVYTINRASTQEYKKLSGLRLNKPNSLTSYQLYNAKNNCKGIPSNYEITPAIEEINSTNLYSISLYKLISKLSAEFNTQNLDSEFHKIIVSQTKSFISISQHGSSKTLISEKNVKEVQASSFNLKRTPLTYVNQNIKNCFCAMNLQIERKPLKKPLKLLPYECEPDVCIPGKCNPIECQKLILNRIVKKTTSKVGTAYNTESVSSQYTPKFKKNKKNAYLQESSTIRRYKNHHSSIANHVRIGSSFNFDIEFFKNTTRKNSSGKNFSSDSNLAKHKRQLKTLRNVGTKKLRYFNDSRSQAELAVTSHKASANLPMMQRCFCTLKLQKKGRLHKESNHKIHKKILMKGSDFYQSSMKVKSTNKGQNTKPLKPTYHLAPYECEPNICNPGYCDPYQCLEIMKRKRVQAAGAHTVWNNKKSMTSMTTTNQSKGTQKSHVKQKVTKTRPKITKASNESSFLKPSRQMVRVGSNFSFNVEFFKDHPGSSPFHKISKDSKEPMKYSEHKNKNMKYQKSEIRNISQVASTMTSSFLKRCFCTAKLYQNNKKKNIGLNLQKNVSPSFFERCLCWFKSKKPEKVSKNIKRNKIKKLNTKTNTQDIDMNVDKNILDRFECDPGMCIPGECNPYECDAILRKKMKRQSMGSSTETCKSHSTFTYNPIHTTKKVNTHSLIKEKQKKPALTKTALESSEKQLVRIGSNFSFNIEFYKDKNPKHDKKFSKSLALQPRSRQGRNKYRGKDTTTKNGAISTHSRLSETLPYKKRDRGIGINNIVKRCFCTLQLFNGQKQAKPNEVKAKTKSIMTEKNKLTSNGLLPFECEPNICIPYQCDPYKCDKIMKSRKNRYGQHNLSLLPYECEPLSCIPGECNPVECLERIKKRQIRDTGTSIVSNKYAAKTMTENKLKPINKINQSKFSQLPKVDKEHIFKMTKEKSSKQAVKIGSKFSFDIEFSKDKTNNESIRKRVKNAKNYKDHEQDANPRDSKSRKLTNLVHKKISKPTMGTFLKKCFCTLKLAKIKAKPGNNIKPVKKKELMKNQTHEAVLLRHTNVTNFSQQLEPYECEPGSCVPGLCNPYECEKRIKKRLKEFSQETENPIQSSKFIATKNVRTKSVKSQALKMCKEKCQLRNKVQAYQDKPDVKKQVCHIGSSFSFDIQFYKNKYPKDGLINKKILLRDADKLNLNSRTKKTKKKMKSSSMGPILKRCFCTLKLHKFPADSTLSPKDVKRTHKGINCDRYECEKQIQICQNPKCRDISSQADKHCSDKCVGFEPQKRKTRYNQSNLLRKHDASSNIHAQKQEIFEVPRFSNIFDKQGVKIGSNFSFNIEFYKKTLLPINSVTSNGKHGIADETRIKRSVPKTLAPYNRGSQISTVSSKDKAVDVGNALKRCFCTLKLQNLNSKPVKKRLHTTPHYPQIVEVRRIAVQRKPKKEFQKKKNPVKSVSTRINNKYLKLCSNTNNRYLNITNDSNEMKTILPYRPVRFNKTNSRTLVSRHVNNDLYKQKDITVTKGGKRLIKKKSLRGIDFNRPPKPNNLKENTATLYIKNMFCRCVQLLNTKNKNHRIANIANESQNLEISNVNNKTDHIQRSKQYALDSLKVSKSDRRPAQPNRTEPKKSKSLKLGNKYNNIKCQKECPIFKHRYSIHQAGDNVSNSSLKYKNKKHKDPRVISNNIQRKQILNSLTTAEDIYCACNAPQQQFKKQKIVKNVSLCCSCQTKMQEKINKSVSSSRRLKVRFLDPLSLSKGNIIKKNVDKEKIKKSSKNKYNKSLKYCTFCNCCGRIFHDETTQKASGDNSYLNRQQQSVSDKIKNISKHRNKAKSKKKSPMFDMKINTDDYGILNKDEIIDNITKLSGQNINKSTIKPQINYACGKADEPEKAVSRPVKNVNLKNRQKVASKKKSKLFKNIQSPVLEMQINSDDYNILNKEEFHHKIAKIREKNITDKSVTNKLCQKCSRCCIYLAKSNKKLNAKDEIRRLNLKKGPCVCGSLICAEKSKKMTVEADKLRRPKKRKPCLCGSPICNHESAIMKSLSVSPDKMTCICKKMRDKEKKKMKKKQDKRENKLRDIRLKQQRNEDKVRLRKRKKENRQLEKKINKNSSAIILLAESVVDIGKLGITACSDVLRVIARTAVDPKHAYRTLKAMKQDPSLIARHVHQAVDDSGVVSTVRRVRLRCMAMKGVKNIKGLLESHPVTNYLLHIAAKDPKRRELKKKNLRVRERLDFGCSLYMGSLRKRPFLCIYDRLPSFYPHFLALVNVYKQFKDLLLFLLAVVVWSPCIVCMEVCRAMMCCLFCTG